MGRAQGQTAAAADGFVALLGSRRGGGPSPQVIADALADGRLDALLSAVDAGAALDDDTLERICARVVAEHVSEVCEQVRATVKASRLADLEESYWGEVSVFDGADLDSAVTAAVWDALRDGESRRVGGGALAEACRGAAEHAAWKLAAVWVRNRGAEHVRRFVGRPAWHSARTAVSTGTEMHPSSGAVAPALLAAVDGAWVRRACTEPDQCDSLAAQLARTAVASYHRR